MLRQILIATAVAGLAACGNSAPETSAPQEAAGPTFAISDAYVRAPAGGRNITGAYLTVTSNSDVDAQIVGVTTDKSGTAELHTHINDEGVMRMRQVMAVELPAHGTAVFQPMHDHVMMFDVEEGLTEGDTVTITLEITHGDTTEQVSGTADVRLRN